MNRCLWLVPAIVVAVAAQALAYVPKQDIKVERDGLTKFKFSGKNTRGELKVEVKDQNLFQGFKGEGTNGTAKVEFEIRSAGLGKGWKITGKNGDDRIEILAKKKDLLSDEWEVTGKAGSREIKETIDGTWDIDPAVGAAFIAFDF
ncbi:MAG: hypothetical protein KDA22_12720 [Phycisphaerales bacterium]|nr:hypothetical protein [Phycisphaerales bacterium]